MVKTHFDLISGPFWAQGALKGLDLAPKGPFGGPEVLSRAQVGQIWSQLHPNGLQGLNIWSPHTLTRYQAPLGPRGILKGSFWPRKTLLGTQEVLVGPQWARFGPNCPRMARLGWTHAHHTL